MNLACDQCGHTQAVGRRFCGACGGLLLRQVAPSVGPSQPIDHAPAPVHALIALKLAKADEAKADGQLQVAEALYDWVLNIDPNHPVARRAKFGLHETRRWNAPWMMAWGEDQFGRWAVSKVSDMEIRFRFCPPGTFIMGSPSNETGRSDDESPQHEVTLTRGIWLGEVPVTNRLWDAVAESGLSKLNGADVPVEKVSWHDCMTWLSHAQSRLGWSGLRLPTEAEWEYACRAGTTGGIYGGNADADTLDAFAWYKGNSRAKACPVRQKTPNPWGLYDMLGNVWEWCADGPRRYTDSPQVDPNGGEGDRRVTRGGSWGSEAKFIRAANRYSTTPDYQSRALGFRLARGE